MMFKCLFNRRLNRQMKFLNLNGDRGGYEYRSISFSAPSMAAANKNYYASLNLDQNATRREIKHSYYKLSKEFHPDVNKDSNAEERFKEIQEAYEVLGDENLKSDYDESLRSGFYSADNHNENNVADVTFRQWKKRPHAQQTDTSSDSSTFGGKTTSYDFDEYFRSHYSFQGSRSKAAKASSASSSKEDLKSYWQRKENEHFNDEMQRNGFYLNRILITVSVFVSLYYVLNYLKSAEEKKFLVLKNKQSVKENNSSTIR